MTRWLIATLGGSDIQYAADSGKPAKNRRLNYFAAVCQRMFNTMQATADIPEIAVPVLQEMITTLHSQGKQPERIVLLYTEQSPGHRDKPITDTSKDTYWAFRILQHLAQETDFFGTRFQVEGRCLPGNPSHHEEMVYLYKEVMTPDWLKGIGLTEADELCASFTTGTPIMTQYLMLGFSSLQFPKHKACYYVPISEAGSGTPYLIPVGELLRHESIWILLENLLRSRQFPAALQVHASTSFSFLSDCEVEIGQWLKVMHQRYLFCFKDARTTLNSCRSVFGQEPFFILMEKELDSLVAGKNKYDRSTAPSLQDTDLKLLIEEYFHKVRFFWVSKLWNEFAFLASSFYEWLLLLAFSDAIGFTFIHRNPDTSKKNNDYWKKYLIHNAAKPTMPAWLKSCTSELSNIKGNRACYIKVLECSPSYRNLMRSSWCCSMNKLYSGIRNIGVHELSGADETEIHRVLGANWVQDTQSMLSSFFHITVQNQAFEQHVEAFVSFLNSRFHARFLVQADRSAKAGSSD